MTSFQRVLTRVWPLGDGFPLPGDLWEPLGPSFGLWETFQRVLEAGFGFWEPVERGFGLWEPFGRVLEAGFGLWEARFGVWGSGDPRFGSGRLDLGSGGQGTLDLWSGGQGTLDLGSGRLDLGSETLLGPLFGGFLRVFLWDGDQI